MSRTRGAEQHEVTRRGLHVALRRAWEPVEEAPGTDPTAARLVLVHGAMDRGSSFARIAARLPDLDVVTYDRRGYAESARTGPSSSFAEQVDDLYEVLARRPAIVAGHSFGGNVVLAAAQAHPDLIPAAVIFEPPAPWEPWWPNTTQRSAVGSTPEEVAERFMRRVVGNRIWEMLPASTQQQRRSEGSTLLAELHTVSERPFDPESVRVPVVVGWGTRSPIHMQQAARSLADQLPHATAYEVTGSNHGVHLSHPAALVEMIRLARSLARTP